MKMFKTLLAAASVTLVVIACAAQNHNQNHNQNPGTQANAPFNSDFDLLGLDSPAFAAEQGEGFGMQHGKGMRGQHMAGFLKKLNLSDAQKAQLKALREETRSEFKNNKETRGQFKQIFKNAFLAAQFDTAAVKNQISPLIAAQKNARSQKMAEKMVQVYSILTPEQRQEVYSQLDQIEKKMAGFAKMPFADKMLQFHGQGHGKGHGNRLEKMATELGLSEAQKTQLKGLFEQGQPQRLERMKAMSGIKTQLVTLFQAGNPSVEKVQAVLSTGLTGMEGQMERHLQMMAKVHDILTPAQREALVNKLETRGKEMHERMRRHHQHNDPLS